MSAEVPRNAQVWTEARNGLATGCRSRVGGWRGLGDDARADAYLVLAEQIAGLECPYPEPQVEVHGQTALEDHLLVPRTCDEWRADNPDAPPCRAPSDQHVHQPQELDGLLTWPPP